MAHHAEDPLMCEDCTNEGEPRPGCCIEPNDAQLAAMGMHIEPTDPYDMESYL